MCCRYYDPVPEDTPTIVVDVAAVPDLTVVLPGVVVNGVLGVKFGASVTLSNVISTCASIGTVRLARIAKHFMLVAHWQVRDQASWAGNLMLAKSHPNFPSDIVLCLVAAEATLTLQTSATAAPTIVSVEAFMAAPFVQGTVVLSAHVPYGNSAGPDTAEYFDTFKVMQRHINAHALVNAGCRLTLTTAVAPAIPTIASARLCFGNIVPGGPLLCTQTEAALVGQPLTMATFTQALAHFKAEVVCAPPAG